MKVSTAKSIGQIKSRINLNQYDEM